MTSKPILVGMNNPQGNKPLFPWPPNCTGYRIWEMLYEKTGCLRLEYLKSFDRINMVDGITYSPAAARARREAVLEALEGRTAVLLGRAVCAALAAPPTPWLLPTWLGHSGVVYQIPHPSGLNRWYNDSNNRDAVSSLLAELYTDYRLSVGLPVSSRRVA